MEQEKDGELPFYLIAFTKIAFLRSGVKALPSLFIHKVAEFLTEAARSKPVEKSRRPHPVRRIEKTPMSHVR
ncbi:MAG: hypothetical protein F6K11_01080 [Leptolyngbya sp. SIO3F4]|nr:hypothetical protein [Leptolyngbya sp. SIO3F4]